ncbi:MAG: sugar transferase, partial [Rhizobacter sp.]|nr:sugar transferase [Chlorobiales bacterium]
ASETNGFSAGGAFVGKRGVWSLAGLRRYRALPATEHEQIDLFYAKNSSLGLDIEILFKAIAEGR